MSAARVRLANANSNVNIFKFIAPCAVHSIRSSIMRAMLVELMVENYAVIERLRIRFHDGLNVLTGETGSGKSIVVDALGLLFGGRASADMLRSGADRARLSGIFDMPLAAAPVLEAAGIEAEDGELLI